MLAGVYRVRQYSVPALRIRYTDAYAIGKLMLCLYDPEHFVVYVRTLKKKLDDGQRFTTSLERVVQGVRYLNSLTDWDAFETLPAQEQERLLFLVNDAYPDYFGAEFAFVQKSLQRAVSNYLRALKRWEELHP